MSRVPGVVVGRAVPPVLPDPFIPRPDLDRRLDDAARRRLVIVHAGAGFGKSTAVAAWSERRTTAWYTATADDRDPSVLASGIASALTMRLPSFQRAMGELPTTSHWPSADPDGTPRARAFASVLADAAARTVKRDVDLVIDDLGAFAPGEPSARLLEGLCLAMPRGLRLVLVSRSGVPFPIERLRAQGQVAAIGETELAFDRTTIARLLEAVLGEGPGDVAADVERATSGWPAAVRLVADALRLAPREEWPSTLRRALRPGGAVFSFLAEEVFDREEPDVRRLVAVVAPLPAFDARLATALDGPAAATALDDLVAQGRFVRPTGDGSMVTLHPLIREFALERMPLGPEAVTVQRRAAAWFVDDGRPLDALACLRAIDDHEGVAALLEEAGGRLLAGGAVASIVEAASSLPDAQRTPEIEQLEGEARQVRGDWDGALACFRRIAGRSGPIPAGVAWRMGLIHHLRGELGVALQTYRRGRTEGAASADVALLHAWRGAAHWLRGETAACRREATRAMSVATAAGDDRALAAGHTVMAMLAATDSDRRANDAHYLRALNHATAAGDVLAIIRIRTNRGSRFVEEGEYAAAIDELDDALRLADLAGSSSFRALALSNRGEALYRLGRLDEAIADLKAARELYQRLESRFICYPLGHLGDVYRERGDRALARACYEEAIATSEAARDLQGLVPSLGGLARVLVDDDPAAATALVERALDAGPVLGALGARVSAGWVALVRGEHAEAASHGAAAAELARARRDRAGLAEALTVLALADGDVRDQGDRRRRAARLEEAASIWADLGSSLAAARTTILLVRAGVVDRAHLDAAEAVLRAAGVRSGVGELGRAWPGLEPTTDREADVPVIRTLGGFQVRREGTAVQLAAWRSRKARDVLKLLIARRGPVARDELAETLWPDEDRSRQSARLSVVLSTIRAVLDPSKRYEADWFVSATRDRVALNGDRLAIDVDAFLQAATAALGSRTAGTTTTHDGHRRDDLRTALEQAEAAYGGDFLPEDVYADWSVGLREEARLVYLRVLAALARLAADDGDADIAVGYLLRILERDRYDESASLQLCTVLRAAGRHGEARRVYGEYLARMAELGVEASPFPDAR